MKDTFTLSNLPVWLARTNSDPEFALSARWTDVRFVIDAKPRPYIFHVAAGCIAWEKECALSANDGQEAIVLAGSASTWSRYLSPVPPPNFNHILGMERRCDDFEIASGRHALLGNLHVISLALALLRDAGVKVEEGSHANI